MKSGKTIRGLDNRGLRTIYGMNPIREAIRAGREIERIYVRRGERRLVRDVDPGKAVAKVDEVADDRLRRIAHSGHHQGIVAKTAPLENSSLNQLVRERGKDIFALMLDGVQDPHNLGAILRVADGAGVDLVIVPSKGAASVQLGSVAKTSAGAVEHVPLLVVGDPKRCVQELLEHDFQVVSMEAGEGKPLADVPLSFPLCLVVGGEDKGVRPRVKGLCTDLAHLPLQGKVGSLNVSVATALACFHAAGRRAPKA